MPAIPSHGPTYGYVSLALSSACCKVSMKLLKLIEDYPWFLIRLHRSTEALCLHFLFHKGLTQLFKSKPKPRLFELDGVLGVLSVTKEHLSELSSFCTHSGKRCLTGSICQTFCKTAFKTVPVAIFQLPARERRQQEHWLSHLMRATNVFGRSWPFLKKDPLAFELWAEDS